LLEGQEKMLRNFIGIPLSRWSLNHGTNSCARHCFFEFLPQVFEIGMHDSLQYNDPRNGNN
jgi:hypothetical protein